MLALSPGGGAGAGGGRAEAGLHKPPPLSLTPKPRSILRRHASDHASDRSSAGGSPSPRSPSNGGCRPAADKSSILSLRRAQSDSLRAIEDIRTCVYGEGGGGGERGEFPLPPPPLFDKQGQGGGSSDSGSVPGDGHSSASLAERARRRDESCVSPEPPRRSTLGQPGLEGSVGGSGGASAVGALPYFSPRYKSRGGGPIPPPPPPCLDDSDSSDGGASRSGGSQCDGSAASSSPRCRQGGRGGGGCASVRFDPRVSVMEYFSADGGGGGRPRSPAGGARGRAPRGSGEDERADDDSAANDKWFTAHELEEFKREAVVLAQKFYLLSCAYSAERLRAEGAGGRGGGNRRGGAERSGGGDADRDADRDRDDEALKREQQRLLQSRQRKALFANPALKATEGDRIVFENSREMSLLLVSQIRNVMVVDPHDVFLDLFYQYVKRMIPHANVVTVKSGEDALRRLLNVEGSRCGSGGRGTRGRTRSATQDGENGQTCADADAQQPRHERTRDDDFDIIIVEERLHQCRLSRTMGDSSSGESSSCAGNGEDDESWYPGRPQSRTTQPSPFSHRAREENDGHRWHTAEAPPPPPPRWQSAGDEPYQHHRRRSARHRTHRRRQRVPMTGSQLLCHISFMQEQRCLPRLRECQDPDGCSNHSPLPAKAAAAAGGGSAGRRSLLIGVSGWLGEDCEKLRRGGADILWGKPPPIMDNRLRNELLMALLAKRGHPIFICD